MKTLNSVMALLMTVLFSGACSTDSPEKSEDVNNYNSSDAVAHWGSDMMDSQSTSYQSLYLKLTKREGRNEDGGLNSELRVWLEGSSQSPESIENNMQVNYCLVEQCSYSDLSLESCVAETRSSGPGVECLVYLPLSRAELGQTGSAMELKVNYCDEVCTESKLEFSSSDEIVIEDNRYSGPDFVK